MFKFKSDSESSPESTSADHPPTAKTLFVQEDQQIRIRSEDSECEVVTRRCQWYRGTCGACVRYVPMYYLCIYWGTAGGQGGQEVTHHASDGYTVLDAEDDYDDGARGDAALLGDAAPAVKAVPGDNAGIMIMMEAAQDVGGGGPTGRGGFTSAQLATALLTRTLHPAAGRGSEAAPQ